MANIFAYENRLWKERVGYTDPGSYEFTLPAGEYLMMCHGAYGGGRFNGYHNLGGVSYGILNLASQTKMHAYVGGNGGDSGNGSNIGLGGFNGGANGGAAYGSNQVAGPGGGGGSDIRLKTPQDFQDKYTPTVPTGYTRLKYFSLNGYTYFDSEYIANTHTTFTASVALANTNQECVLMGAQSGFNVNPGWVVWLNSKYNGGPCLASIYGSMSWYAPSSSYDGAYMCRTMIPVDEQATYRIDRMGTFVNEKPLWVNTAPDGTPCPDKTMKFCMLERDSTLRSDTCFVGKVFFFRIYEEEDGEYVLKHEYIPAIRDSDGVIGLCDCVTGSEHVFLEPIHMSASGTITAGPSDIDPIETTILSHRYYPTIPEEYIQVEYLETPGGVYFDSGYCANENTIFTCRVMSNSYSVDKVLLGSQSGVNTDPGWLVWLYAMNSDSAYPLGLASIYGTMGWSSGTYFYRTYVPMTTPLMCRIEKNRTFANLLQLSSYTPSGTPEPDRTIWFLDSRRSSEDVPYSSNISFIGRVYHYRIYEKIDDVDVLLHEFVPCKRVSDNVVGLYDVIENPETHEHQFLEPLYRSSPVTLTTGAEGPCPILDYDGLNVDVYAEPDDSIYRSLNTRIIVAGGGGGAAIWESDVNYKTYAGIGGGVYGGFMQNYTTTSPPYATQTDGASFGEGQVGRNSTNYYNSAGGGAGGGGGGWYGGYASTTTAANSQAAGGGGSGYVLTDTSYIPSDYMEGHEPYHMTNVFMGSGYAEYPCVRVCEPCESISAGDKIIVYGGFGKGLQIPVPPGEYVLKCWGANGGAYYSTVNYGKGGYAEGTLRLTSSETLFAHVGGSGMYYDLLSSDYVHIIRPDMSYNGGGPAAAYGTSGSIGAPGGGGTDIRIGVDSLYARVIVAGGSAGTNAVTSVGYYGGAGGGTTGGSGYSGGNGGYSPGPGTQTESPPNPDYPTITGGFGFGGSPYSTTSRNPGGGGGGWYGGSSSADTTGWIAGLGANGGSGYTFTANSYKPKGYLLEDRFQLSDTLLIQGGNNLPCGIAKIEIDVIDTKTYRVLCRDKYGIKRYDENQERWVWIDALEPTVDLFLEYGSLTMPNDTGLDDDYEILVYDPEDTITTVALDIVPNKVTIKTETITDINIRNMTQKLEFDPALFSIDITAKRQTLVSGTKVKTEINVEQLAVSDKDAKIFYITYSDGQ